jgi:hypothetical protein
MIPSARLDRTLVRNKGGNITCYVYGLGLIGQEESGIYQNYHFDSRGSTVAMTDARSPFRRKNQTNLSGSAPKNISILCPAYYGISCKGLPFKTQPLLR